MLAASANMSREDGEVQIERNAEHVAITVSASSLKGNFIIDFAALIRGPQVSPPIEPAEEGEETTPSSSGKGKGKGRRREEAEEYDLNDPFIDDAELPPGGVTLQELLAMDANGDEPTAATAEGFSPSMVRPDDFYVWRGPLPARQVDPLWLERAMEAAAAAKAGSRGGKKRRRSQPTKAKGSGKRSKEQSSNGEGDEQPGQKRRGSPRAKRVRREKTEKGAETGESGEVSKVRRKERANAPGTSAKSKLSIMDRIVAMGDADEQANEAIAIPPTRREEEAEKLAEGGEPPGEGEEKMRKRYDYTTPYLELEERLAMAAVQEAAARIDFTDPKKFPSALRPYVNEAIVCCLRRQERKDRLPESFFIQLASLLPFTPGSLEKLTYTKLTALHRDELATKVIPQMLDELKSEVHALVAGDEVVGSTNIAGEAGEANTAEETAVPPTVHTTKRFNEKIRQLLVDLVKCELDRQALDRLATVQAGGRYASFSETSCRKAFYPRVAACWPEGPSTVEVAREYTTARRKAELRLLREHHIEVQPTLIPISSHGKGGKAEAGGGRSTEEPSRVASQLDSQIDQPEGVGETGSVVRNSAPPALDPPLTSAGGEGSPLRGDPVMPFPQAASAEATENPLMVDPMHTQDHPPAESRSPVGGNQQSAPLPLTAPTSSFLETVMNAAVEAAGGDKDDRGQDQML